MIGKLRHRITIESKGQASDGAGGYIESWSPFATLWAEVKPINSRERFQAEQVQARTTHRIWIRYRDDLETDMRVSYQSRSMAILGITDPDERKHWLVIDCEEGAPA